MGHHCEPDLAAYSLEDKAHELRNLDREEAFGASQKGY